MKGFFQCNGFFNSNVFFFNLVLSERVVLEVFCQKNVFRIFSKFLGKHLCRSLVFNKVAEHLRATVSVLSKSSLMKGLWLARKYPSLRKKCSYSELFWYLSVFNPNAEKCVPEYLRMRILFTQWLFTRYMLMPSYTTDRSESIYLTFLRQLLWVSIYVIKSSIIFMLLKGLLLC